LEKANSGLSSALRVVESSDRAVPAQAIELYEQSSAATKLRVGEWSQFKTLQLPQLNRALQQANAPTIVVQKAISQ
jgi:hypothetical protein